MSNKDKSACMVVVQSHKAFQHQTGNTLLESLEAQQLEAHFHCREGYCGACRCKLLSGSVRYNTDPLAFIDDDEILPCCCEPDSDIEIELG